MVIAQVFQDMELYKSVQFYPEHGIDMAGWSAVTASKDSAHSCLFEHKALPVSSFTWVT